MPHTNKKLPDTGYGYALKVIHSRLVKLDTKVDALTTEITANKIRHEVEAKTRAAKEKARVAVFSAVVSGIIALVARFIP